MAESCFSLAELEEIAALPPGDPRRQHLERCARCRALLGSYQAFAREPASPSSEQERDLDVRLAAALERQIFGTQAPGSTGESEPVPFRGTRGRGWFGKAFLGRPALRIAAMAAAVLLIAFGVRQARWLWTPGVGEITLRDAAPAGTDAFSARVRFLPQDGWLFSWAPVRDADGYRIALYGADLRERSRREAQGSDSSLTVSRADLPASVAQEGVLFWRVIAFERGDETGRTRLQSLPMH